METAVMHPVDHENANRHWLRVAGWWERCELDERWPLTSEQAATLLCEAGQYEIDAAGLEDMVSRNLLSKPGIDDDGNHEWLAGDVCGAGVLLEEREQWQPTPSGHDRKKHCFQVALENARERGIVGDLSDSGGVRYDVRGLLPALVKCETLEGRRQIVALLKAVLQHEHDLIV